MELSRIRALRGPNLWSRHTAIEAIVRCAEDERDIRRLAAFEPRLRGYLASGLPCPVVSVGSTPTAMYAAHLRGVTELRCGVYMFGDLFQAAIGSCTEADIAISVLTAVIGHRRDRNTLLIDAGALALSRDLSTQRLPAAQQAGFGGVATLDGVRLPGLSVAGVSQEHGQITGPAPIDFEKFPIGTRLRILPVHSCLTAAAYDRYHVLDGGPEVVATWTRTNGW